MTSVSTNSSVYNVTGKYREGKEISKYQISDLNGNRLAINKRQLCFLIGAGLVDNCSVSFSKQGPIFRGNGIDLRDLPELSLNQLGKPVQEKEKEIDKFNLTCELVKDFRIIGFEMLDKTNNLKRYKLSDALKLINMGRVTGLQYKDGLIASKDGLVHGLKVVDMETNTMIGRTVLTLNKYELGRQLQFRENISGIGKLELVTNGLGSEFLDDRKIITNIKTHSLDGYRIVNIFGDTIRLTNNQGIIDIVMEGKDVSKLKRPEILRIIATAILKYDTDSNVVAIQINDLDNQRLATYNYKG